MVNEFDAREPTDRREVDRQHELAGTARQASESLPGAHHIRVVSFDRETGNPGVIVSIESDAVEGNYVARALDHLQRIGPAFGLAADQPAEFLADPREQRTSSGAAVVHVRQLYKGIRIYEATETVRFDPKGRLTEVAGRAHTVTFDLPVDPVLTPAEALVRAAEHLAQPISDPPPLDPFGQPLLPPAIDLANFDPQPILTNLDQPDRPTTFRAPPFEGSSTVSLIWFPLQGNLRLAWHMVVGFSAGPQHRVIVDAVDGNLLLSRLLVRSIMGHADVFLPTGNEPRQRVSVPLALDTYGFTVPDDLPDGFPYPWLSGSTTAGTNVAAIVSPTMDPTAGTNTNGEVVLSSPDHTGDDQLVINLFVLNGMMHDALYLLGFRENDGNFQTTGTGSGGIGGDRVSARVHPDPVWGTANMSTPPDGFQPQMNMGLVESTGRHTALDGDVVIHEYCHGLTNRVVGGPMDTAALDAQQSAGMGEGWGDYFACVLNNVDTVGSWVTNRQTGIRRHRYDQNYPGTFADLGTAAYSAVHDIGELWCAVLMDLNRRLGTPLAAQLVVDALKLSASNPGFLAMRDALLVGAGDHAMANEYAEDQAADLINRIWQTFAAYGMGPGAASIEATLGGIEADFNTPPSSVPVTMVSGTAAPALNIPDDDPSGVVSTIELIGAGGVAGIEISVEISHTYRGDLTVDLQSPSGTMVRLHDRNGAGQDDLATTWTVADRPGLAALIGEPVSGNWSLAVADHARIDTGRLEKWGIEVVVAEPRPTVGQATSPALAVPDNDEEGVESSIDLSGAGTITALVLDVDLTHSWIGDLVVSLTGPAGHMVTVHDRHGEGADNLIAQYRSAADGPLASFVGLPVAGTWTLSVSDHANRDVGKLNHWSLNAEL